MDLQGPWGRRAPATAALLVAALVAGGRGTAVADTGAAADAAVRRDLAQVRVMQGRVDAALAGYRLAVDAAAGAVSREIGSEQLATETAQHDAAVRGAAGARARALYRNGGALPLYASILTAHDLGDAVERLGVARHLVGADTTAVGAADAAGTTATRGAATAEARALAQLRSTRAVLDSFAHLQDLLAQQQALLDAAQQHAGAVHAAEELARRIAAARAAAEAAGNALVHRLGPMPGSADYFALYHAAARTCPGLSWTVLAAIGQVESGHGRNPGVSSAGAVGPMQFEPATFAHYGVDVDGKDAPNIMDPADAIYTAAHYLCANGAGTGPQGLANAIWHYNHADWYVRLVLDLAAQYAAQQGA